MDKLKYLEQRVEKLEADLAHEQRTVKNLMIDQMKVSGPPCATRSTLLAKVEALEELGRGLVDVIDRSQAKRMAAEYRKQAGEHEE